MKAVDHRCSIPMRCEESKSFTDISRGGFSLKKILSILVILCILLSIFTTLPHSAVAAENQTFSGTSGDCSWVVEDGVLIISGNGRMADYDSSVPWLKAHITGAVIEEGVTYIGKKAFSNSTGMKTITIPDSVNEIGEYAFNYCISLKAVTIPDSVTSLPKGLFYNCSRLETVNLPDGLESFGEYTFTSCSSLRTVKIPEAMTNIGKSAFFGCTGLEEITIPDHITSIEENGFRNCQKLVSINIPRSVTFLGYDSFRDCSGLTEVILPDTIDSINGYTFRGCSSLQEITIPDSVGYISAFAFAHCTNLKEVYIPESVIAIALEAFMECESLQNIHIPNSVISIGGDAFRKCSSLKEIVIPDSVKTLDGNAFINCKSLEKVSLGKSVTTIEDGTFRSCTALESISIPKSVTKIEKNAFRDCGHLSDVYYHGSEEMWSKITIEASNDDLLNANIHFINVPITSDYRLDINDDGQTQLIFSYSVDAPEVEIESGRINIDVVCDDFSEDSCIEITGIGSGGFESGYNSFSFPVTAASAVISLTFDGIPTQRLYSIAQMTVETSAGEGESDPLVIDYHEFVTIEAPDMIDTQSVLVHGRTVPNHELMIFVDDVPKTSVTADGSGSYSANLDLDTDDALGHSYIIRAQYTDGFGIEHSASCRVTRNIVLTLPEKDYMVLRNDGQQMIIFGELKLPEDMQISDDMLNDEVNAINWETDDSDIMVSDSFVCTSQPASDNRSATLMILFDVKGCGIFHLTGTTSNGFTSACEIAIEPLMQLEADALYPEKIDLNDEDFYTKEEKLITCYVNIPNPNPDYLDSFMNGLTFEIDEDKLEIVDTDYTIGEGGKDATYRVKVKAKVDNDTTAVSFISSNGQVAEKEKSLDMFPGWGFHNISANDYFPRYDSIDNATFVDRNYIYFKQATANNGECHGMAVSALLNQNGVLNHREFDENADSLYSIQLPTSPMKTMIQYCYLLQFTKSYKNGVKNFKKMDVNEQLRTIANMTEPFLLAYSSVFPKIDSPTPGHVVVGYEVEKGSFTSSASGKTYPKRVVTYDSNDVTGDPDYYFLFDDSKGTWEVPHYYNSYKFTSDYSLASIDIATADPNVYANDDFTDSGETISKATEMIFLAFSPINVEYYEAGKKYAYDILSSFCSQDGEVLAIPTNNGVGDNDNHTSMNLYLPHTDTLSITPLEEGSGLNAAFLNSGSAGNIVRSDNYDELELEQDGSVELLGIDGNFGITSILNSFEGKKYQGVTIEGDGTGSVSTQIKNDGIILNNDGIDTVRIAMYDTKSGENLFCTDVTSANGQLFIDTTDNDKLTVWEDLDGDGEFEYQVATVQYKKNVLFGDIDGDGVVTIIDVTYIQRELADLPIPFEISDDAADVDGDGKVTVIDATYIQRWLVGLKSNGNIGKIIDQ